MASGAVYSLQCKGLIPHFFELAASLHSNLISCTSVGFGNGDDN